jgi:hypothetical protein
MPEDGDGSAEEAREDGLPGPESVIELPLGTETFADDIHL